MIHSSDFFHFYLFSLKKIQCKGHGFCAITYESSTTQLKLTEIYNGHSISEKISKENSNIQKLKSSKIRSSSSTNKMASLLKSKKLFCICYGIIFAAFISTLFGLLYSDSSNQSSFSTNELNENLTTIQINQFTYLSSN